MKKYCPFCAEEYAEDIDLCPQHGVKLLTPESDPMIGSVLGDRYEVVAFLGSGGMSVVYKGRHRLMNKMVAIKMLHSKLLGDTLTMKRFQQEAEGTSRLGHNNVVTVHDFGVTDSQQPYLVMDFVAGKTIAQILDQNGFIPVERSLNIFVQICQGLNHAHKHGIIHRDLKPSNIMLLDSVEGELVKILDFGLAKLLPTDGESVQKLTQTGEFFGTAYYMSPEQCAGNAIDLRSDIYSLGCVMYETLVGLPPFMADNVLKTMQCHSNEIPRTFREVRQDIEIPAALETIVRKCIEKKPEDRYQSVDELLKELRSQLDGLRSGSVPTAATPIPVVVSAQPRRKRLMAYAAAGFIFAFGTLVLVSKMSSSTPETPDSAWKNFDSTGQQAFEHSNYAEAEKQFQQALKEAERFGDHDRRLLSTLHKLSDVYYVEGKYDLADQIEARTAQIKQQIAGTHQPSKSPVETVSQSVETKSDSGSERVANLAKVCHEKGQCDVAEKLFKKSVQISEKVYGSKSAQTAARLNDLAAFYMGMGEMDKAEPLVQQAMDIEAAKAK
jgi:serine/threonine protein kinase